MALTLFIESYTYTPQPYEAYHQQAWYEPDSIVTQTGGYTGLATIGVGYDIGKYYRTDVIAGYVPEIVGGEDLWSLSWKNTFVAPKMGRIEPYLGLNLLYSFDDDTYVTLPEQYPRGYYPTTALRTAAYIGVSDLSGLYAELTTLDHYMEAYVRSDGELNYWEIGTYAIGYRWRLQ